jgi:hypothetical protein
LAGAAGVAVIQFITVEFGQIMTMTFVPLKAEAAEASVLVLLLVRHAFHNQLQRYKWFF